MFIQKTISQSNIPAFLCHWQSLSSTAHKHLKIMLFTKEDHKSSTKNVPEAESAALPVNLKICQNWQFRKSLWRPPPPSWFWLDRVPAWLSISSGLGNLTSFGQQQKWPTQLILCWDHPRIHFWWFLNTFFLPKKSVGYCRALWDFGWKAIRGGWIRSEVARKGNI